MAVKRSHGRPRPQVPAADRLPDGVPAAATPAPRGNRGARGQLVPGSDTSALAAAGGRARAEALRLDRLLGRVELPEDHPRAPYRRDATAWRAASLQRLAERYGDGEVGPMAAGIISLAALQHGASLWLFDQCALLGDPKLAMAASRLADACRGNVLSAIEIVAKDAAAKKRRPDRPWYGGPAEVEQALRDFGLDPATRTKP